MTTSDPKPRKAPAHRGGSTDHSPGHAQPTRVRLLCVDDHAVLVEGLKAQFAIDGRIQVVGRLPSAQDLLQEVTRLDPDVVLLDIEMPGPDVFEMADRMHHIHPGLRFIFLSAHIRDGYLAAAFQCGAWGYFGKGDELEDIAAGILEVARSPSGTFVMGPKVRERCAAAPSRRAGGDRRRGDVRDHEQADGRCAAAPATPLATLTARELEVLRLIGRGLSRTEIAAELSRSAKTVDGHQERVMKKLGISSRTELTRFAIREGLAEA